MSLIPSKFVDMLQPVREIQNTLVVIAALLFGAAFGAPVVLNNAYPPAAQLDVISDSPRETVLEFRFGAIDVDSVTDNGTEWVTLHVAGMQSTSQSGWPDLPQLSKWILHSSASVVEIIESEHAQYSWGTPWPAAQPLPRTAPAQFTRTPVLEFYHGSEAYPVSPVSLSLSGQLRGMPVGLLSITPVQFDPLSGLCTAYTRLRVRITQPREALDQLPPRSRASSFLLERLLMTHPEPPQENSWGSPGILIVTEPQFVSALQPFIDWKLRSGLRPQTIIYSQVAATPLQLRNYLAQLVDSSQVPPDYLLIVGDVDVIPAFYGIEGTLTDHPYSTLQGSDYLPDLSVGRLPCHTALECTDWVNRLLSYERDGQIANGADATVFSSSSALDPQHGIAVESLFDGAGFATDHFQEPQNSSLPSLMNSLNSGREWIFYIGHGFPQAWSSVSPYFDNGHANEIQTAASSIVLSVACATADFDYPETSLAEHWLEQSSASGVLAYFGATEPTAFFYSDTIGLGAVRAVFSQHVERLGDAADLGKLATAQAFPQAPGGLTEETIQQFELLGDPSLRVFSAPPQPLTVSYSSTIPLNVVNLPVTVQTNDQPVVNAEVCLSSNDADFFVVRFTDQSGETIVPINLADPAVLHLTVTALNAVPFVGVLNVVPPSGPFLQLASISVLDSAGDNDGRADRGEAGALRVALANLGNQSSPSGSLGISANDPRVQVSTSTLSVGGISPGDTVWCASAIPISVSDTARDLSAPLLSVHALFSDSSQFSAFQPLVLHAPDISFLGHDVVEDSGDGDGFPEAGENLSLVLRMQNDGSDRMLPAVVNLSTSSTTISLLDTSAIVLSVGEGDTFSVPFRLHAALNTPRGDAFNFSYSIVAPNLPALQGTGLERIGQVPIFLFVLDQQPAQVNAIQAALLSLGIESERAGELPQNLNRYHSIWTFCGVFPNQMPLSENDGQRLADYLQSGGNCYLEGADTWAFDPPTALHPFFHINGLQDGTSNAGPFIGEYGTEYQDYAFEYDGEDMFIDQLGTGNGAMVMLRNHHPGADYPVCIAYAGENFRTVGSSVELGAVLDAAYPSTRVHLINDLCHWFGIESRADIYPPVIVHEPLEDCRVQFVPITIIADIQDASGIQSAIVFYRLNDGPDVSAPMELVEGLYQAFLPGARFGSVYHYRLQATDSSPLHTTAETSEFALPIAAHPDEPLSYHFAEISRFGVHDGMTHDGDAAWAITGHAGSDQTLQLQSASNGTSVFTTKIFDCSQVSAAHLEFSHCLHAESPAASARVLASTDGGHTFPIVLWERSASNQDISDCAVVALSQLEALGGQSAVVVRFEFDGPGFWRLRDVSVTGESSSATKPVSRVTISAHGETICLYWPACTDALYYVVKAATSTGPQDFTPIATTHDTTFCDADAKDLKLRLYAVEAVIGNQASAASVLHVSDALTNALRTAEDQWKDRTRASRLK